MIRHIVWWTLKPEAEGRSAAENAELMKKAARGLIREDPRPAFAGYFRHGSRNLHHAGGTRAAQHA